MSALEDHTPPRDAALLQALHARMVEALLDGGGLHAVARVAAKAAGGRIVIDLPQDGLAAATPGGGDAVVLRVPISAGGDPVGTVALHGDGSPPPARAADALHAAAMATLTYVALLREDQPRPDPAARPVEAVLDGRPDARALLRAAGVEAGEALSAQVPAHGTGRVLAALADHAPGAARAVRDGWVHVLLVPGTGAARLAQTLHERLGIAAAGAPVGPGGDPAVALREARLAAQLVADGAASPAAVAGGTWRLLVRGALREPAAVAELAHAALGPMADDAGAAGEQLRTFAAYVANNCNMNATAAAMPAHRHTVAYRLDRIRELTGLDPLAAEDREQLGVALKARAVTRARAVLDRGAGI